MCFMCLQRQASYEAALFLLQLLQIINRHGFCWDYKIRCFFTIDHCNQKGYLGGLQILSKLIDVGDLEMVLSKLPQTKGSKG